MNVPIDISNKVFTTERLIIRPWKNEDLEDFYEYARVEGVGEMAGWSTHKDIEESKRILDIFIKGKKTLSLEMDGKVIGSLGIEEYDNLPELEGLRGRELGYSLSKDYWGRGLMPEAVEKIIEYLFTEVNLDFIACGHWVLNNQSRRVQEKCGFKYFKDYSHITNWGEERKSKKTILYKKDWEMRKNK